jgi:hypothetical protein
MDAPRKATPMEQAANERALARLRKLFPRLPKVEVGAFLIDCTAYPFAPLTYCVHKQAAELSRRAHKDVARAYLIVDRDTRASLRHMNREDQP